MRSGVKIGVKIGVKNGGKIWAMIVGEGDCQTSFKKEFRHLRKLCVGVVLLIDNGARTRLPCLFSSNTKESEFWGSWWEGKGDARLRDCFRFTCVKEAGYLIRLLRCKSHLLQGEG